MTARKPIIVNNKGMITIPVDIRRKHHLDPGTAVSIMEIHGHLEIIPLIEIEQLRTRSVAEFLDVMKESDEIERAIENEKKGMP